LSERELRHPGIRARAARWRGPAPCRPYGGWAALGAAALGPPSPSRSSRSRFAVEGCDRARPHLV